MWSKLQVRRSARKRKRRGTDMAGKRFNIFTLVARLLRVGSTVAAALKDKKITKRERDEIVAVLLMEITQYLDELDA